MSLAVKLAHVGFGLPAPGSGFFSTSPADETISHSKPVTGSLSPGLTTMCFAASYSSL